MSIENITMFGKWLKKDVNYIITKSFWSGSEMVDGNGLMKVHFGKT